MSDEGPLNEIGPATEPAPETPAVDAPDPTTAITPGLKTRKTRLDFSQPDPNQGPPITRADCTWLGVKIFALGAALAVAASVVPSCVHHAYLYFTDGALEGTGISWRHTALAAYLIVPPLALLGALVGFEAYRLVTHSRRPLVLPGVAWAILLLMGLAFGATFVLFLPLYLHARLREKLLTGERELDLLTAWVHLGYMLLLPLVLFFGIAHLAHELQRRPGLDDLAAPLLTIAWALIWISDNLLLLALAAWRSVRLLATPPSKTFQFTLGALMLTTLGLGAWVSGLMVFLK